MSYDTHDTIAAIATATGGAARGMIRVSGPATNEIVASCFIPDGAFFATRQHPAVNPGCLTIQLRDHRTRPLACDLFHWPTGRSYTRQPVAEFHLVGSRPILQAALDAICAAGARLAEPGEFTLRAFLAGRLDLTQAEAVLGVIDSQRSDQLHAALRQLAGGIADPLARLRNGLLDVVAQLEAGLDFVEEDIEFISPAELTSRLQAIATEITEIAAQMVSRQTSNSGCQVVLTGPPNAGKSSLFNALAKRFGVAHCPNPSAIVSAECGTTRDYLTATIDLAGICCELVDTAGVEESPSDEIATLAQIVGNDRRRHAVVRAFCVDAAKSAECVVPPAELVILTKSDITPKLCADGSIAVASANAICSDSPTVLTSAVTGHGLDALHQALLEILSGSVAQAGTACIDSTAERCRDSLRLATAAISRAIDIAEARGGDELIAVELRFCLDELGKVAGTVYTDDILDRIFKTFCIGK